MTGVTRSALAVVIVLTASGLELCRAEEPGARREPQQSRQESPRGASRRGASQEPDQEQEQQRPTLRDLGRTGGQVRLGQSRFVFEEIATLEGADNDLFVWAWMPTLAGTVGDNAFIGAQKLRLEAGSSVGGDLFLFVQSGTVAGNVDGDIYAFVAELSVDGTAVIGGGMYGSSASLDVAGTVRGPISYKAGATRLDGHILGDVRLEVGELEIGPNAVIEGDVRYESPKEAVVDSAAVISGELRQIVPAGPAEDDDGGGGIGFWSIFWPVWRYLASLIVGVVLLALGGEAARRPSGRLRSMPAQGLGFGFVVAVVTPAAAFLGLLLIVTLPLGILLLMLYLVALYVARLVTAHCVGAWMLRRARGGAEPSAYLALAIGLLVFYLLVAIPYLGFLLWIAALVAGLGGMYLALRGAETRPPAEAPLPPPAPGAV